MLNDTQSETILDMEAQKYCQGNVEAQSERDVKDTDHHNAVLTIYS